MQPRPTIPTLKIPAPVLDRALDRIFAIVDKVMTRPRKPTRPVERNVEYADKTA